MTQTSIPAYCGYSGDINVTIERDTPSQTVRFISPLVGRAGAKSFCFHVDNPQAAVTLINYLQPLADKAPKPREVAELGDDEKDAIWRHRTLSKGRYMWSPAGWLASYDNGATWKPAPWRNYDAPGSFIEVLN